jgi:hypothetical protein
MAQGLKKINEKFLEMNGETAIKGPYQTFLSP